MGNKRKIGGVLAIFFLLFMLPQMAFAADKEKQKEKEYNFNEEKTVVISEEKSYAVSDEYTWLKYKSSADGCLTVQVSDPDGTQGGARGYIALYNSTKSRALSPNTIFYNTAHTAKNIWRTFTFGLSKGQEYYLRIRAENAVQITRKFTKIKDVSGISRAKAKKLNKNKARTGLIPANSSAADWYRIDLAKKQKIGLYYSANTTGSFKMTVFAGKRRLGSRNISYTAGQKVTIMQSEGQNDKKKGMPPGKYYIKMEQANALASGSYKLKWN